MAAASGEVPAREGVLRLMDEAREQGLLVGVCSAATKSSAICVLESLLGKDRFQVSIPHLFTLERPRNWGGLTSAAEIARLHA